MKLCFENNTVYDIGGNDTIIGRNDLECQLVLQEASVSGKHAKLELVSSDTAMISDLNSTNGTFVNGKQIGAQPIVLQQGDRIRLGNYPIFTFSGDAQRRNTIANEDTPTKEYIQDGNVHKSMDHLNLYKQPSLKIPQVSKLGLDDMDMYELLEKNVKKAASLRPGELYRSGRGGSNKVEEANLNLTMDQRESMHRLKEESANLIRKINMVSAGSLTYSDLNRHMTHSKSAIIAESDSEAENDDLPEMFEVPQSVMQHVQSGVQVPAVNAPVEKPRQVANDRSVLLKSMDRWRQFTVDRLRLKQVYITLTRIATANKRAKLLRAWNKWNVYIQTYNQHKKLEQHNMQLVKLKEQQRIRFNRMDEKRRMDLQSNVFYAWTMQLTKTQTIQFKIESKHYSRVEKLFFKHWKQHIKLIASRRKAVWRQLSAVARKRKAKALLRWKVNADKIAFSEVKMKVSSSVKVAQKGLNDEIALLKTQVSELKFELANANRMLSEQEINNVTPEQADQKLLIQSLRRQLAAAPLTKGALQLDQYQREAATYKEQHHALQAELRGKQEENKKLHNEIQAQHENFAKQAKVFGEIMDDANLKLMQANKEIAANASVSKGRVNAKRACAAQFLVKQIYEQEKSMNFTIVNLRQELLTALQKVDIAQTATLRAQDEAQEAKHYMHLYEKLKNELRTKDAFEAYQLIEILQGEIGRIGSPSRPSSPRRSASPTRSEFPAQYHYDHN